jgi:hypothetical protein
MKIKAHAASGGPIASDPESEKKVATAIWKPVGGFGLFSSLALLAAMTSEKVGPSVLSFIGQNPFAITLFGIPVLSAVLVALCIAGGAYARAVGAKSSWDTRVPPIVEELEQSSLSRRVSLVILVGFILVPLLTLLMANVKFFEGTFYYSSPASKGCDEKQTCENLGAGWHHFHVVHGLSLTNTPYRYEGNKTYIPIVYPVLVLSFSTCAWALCVRYLVLVFSGESLRSSFRSLIRRRHSAKASA